MKAYVGVTDLTWYELLSARMPLQEVNFWQPSGNRLFRALDTGGLFLFKLHSPNDYIVGGGLFVHSSLLPVSLAWESFGLANGVTSLPEMRARIERYRRTPYQPFEDYTIGCIILTQPFFFRREAWIPIPSDWARNIVQGRGYDLTAGLGLHLYEAVERAAQANTLSGGTPLVAETVERYGSPVLTRPRLGQGAFRSGHRRVRSSLHHHG